MAKRLQKEINDLTNNPPDWCKAQIVGDTMYKWRATVIGPDKSPYEKGVFQIDVDIPTEYPFKPPKMKFATKIYHPNVKSDGLICLDILGDAWSPQIKIQEVLMTLRTLLSEPNPDNPLEAEIANQFKSDRKKFDKTAAEWTKKYATA